LLVVDHHVGYVGQVQRLAVLHFQDHVGEVIGLDALGRINNRRDVPDRQPLIAGFQPAAGAYMVTLGEQ